MGTGPIEGDQGPDYDQVLQLESAADPAVQVAISDTVQVQEAQSAGGSLANKNLLSANTSAVKLLNPDLTRGRTTLVSGGSYYLGYTKAECEAKIAQIPAGVPIVIDHGEAVWVIAAGADTYVTAVVSQWTK